MPLKSDWVKVDGGQVSVVACVGSERRTRGERRIRSEIESFARKVRFAQRARRYAITLRTVDFLCISKGLLQAVKSRSFEGRRPINLDAFAHKSFTFQMGFHGARTAASVNPYDIIYWNLASKTPLAHFPCTPKSAVN